MRCITLFTILKICKSLDPAPGGLTVLRLIIPKRLKDYEKYAQQCEPNWGEHMSSKKYEEKRIKKPRAVYSVLLRCKLTSRSDLLCFHVSRC